MVGPLSPTNYSTNPTSAAGYSVFAVIQADPSAPLALPHTEADEVASTLPEPSQPRSESHNSAGFDDEDLELQAALQASITGTASYVSPSGSRPELESSSAQNTVSGAATPNARAASDSDPTASGTGVDPVAASMTRNRIIMERIRREQELAQRELYEAESNRIDRRRTASQEEEEELLRRAIAESKAEAQREGRALEDDEDEIMEPDFLPPAGNIYPNDRVYDDEDEELQMALQESLEAVPEGFPSDIPPQLNQGIETSSKVEVNDTSVPSSHQQEVPQEAQAVNIDEIRKKRLARFGG
jgi:Ataxin-3